MTHPSNKLELVRSPQPFAARHIGPDADEVERMLERVGFETLEALVEVTVPASIRRAEPLELPEAANEQAMLAEARELAAQNQVYRSYIGQGYHRALVPPVIQRNILENPAWYTQYTPYQAEIAQGRLEALLNFQTMVTELTRLEIANASLLDEGTAAAEAMSMCHGAKRGKRSRFVVDPGCHPQTIDVVRTRAEPMGIVVEVADLEEASLDEDVFGVLAQYPATDGRVRDLRGIIERAHEVGALVTVAADILSLVLLEPPGALGADVAVGSTQRFGVPMGFGGPHAAYFATREKFKRKLPGRLVGVTRDAHGAHALRLALQTREQHIRRDRATSNICTSQVLLAVMASMYAVYHGPEGLERIARRVKLMTEVLALALEQGGLSVSPGPRFDTVAFEATGSAREAILERAEQARVELRELDEARLSITLDEATTLEELEALVEVVTSEGLAEPLEALLERAPDGFEGDLARTSPCLEHAIFDEHHSEHEMLRYMYRLQQRDLSLTTSMIPLGSCTMKLNATAEMMPITLEGFAQLHPFSPPERAPGYARMIAELEGMLGEITGLPGVSLQPNAGSQGEYTGLLTIRAWHASRGESHRDVCLIPSSAHGTNPASAVMAGMEVVVVACDEQGDVDLEDLRARAEEHADRLAALMVTYPSTHGVFEEAIVEICQIVHEHGGQVYMDGANMNAQVGLCRPGDFGVDVCHLNLHKTFCLARGTPVTLSTGQQRPIEELLVGQEVMAFSEECGGVEAAWLEARFPTGRKACVELTLEDGRTITCTPDHRVKTTEGWVEVGDLDPSKHRVLVGLEAPLDLPEDRADEEGWSATFEELELSLETPQQREETLAFFRLLGMVFSDGTYSQESTSDRTQIRLYLGTLHDARAVVEDVWRLTGKRPSISSSNQIFSIRVPVELLRAMESLPGFGRPGPRVESLSGFPEVITDPITPRSVLREFYGALFGGDGSAPLVVHLADNPNTMKEVRFAQTRIDRGALERLMKQIQSGLARLGVSSYIGKPYRPSPSDLHPGPEQPQRWRCEIAVRWGTAFAERVGFRYCTHKAARLTAATAWWRMKETVMSQRSDVAQRALELGDGVVRPGARSMTWRMMVSEAYQQVADATPILNSYFAGFEGNQRVSKQHLEVAIHGNPRRETTGQRRGHRRAVLPSSNKKGVDTGMPSLDEFLERTGTRGWFNEHTPGGSGYNVAYAVGQEHEDAPVMKLGVVSVRPVGEREVYDLTVADLHTFLANGIVVHNCIPHGGGGPGVGPIAAAEHLAPFLPGHAQVEQVGGEQAIGPVAAAPWGSAGILPISWMYVRMMGPQGLRRASQVAILNANYLARRLGEHYELLYTGAEGTVAHEFILDLRPITEQTGVTVADVAKRLMDYGFHAPTMSWPVAGALMVEPTESESLAELDRFADAMIAIRAEIAEIADGQADPEDNLLKNAPHTAAALTEEPWSHPYSRERAVFPAPWVRQHKFWPSVARVDDAYGDRNLMCSCPPLESYQPQAAE